MSAAWHSGTRRLAALLAVLAMMAAGRAEAKYLPGYVTDGLIAHWDGIDNAATGTHVASTNAWTDLIGGRQFTFTGAVTVNDDRMTFPGNNAIYATLDSAGTAATFAKAATTQGATIEYVFKANSTANAFLIQSTSGVTFRHHDSYSDLCNTTHALLNWAWNSVQTNTMSVTYANSDPGDAYVNGDLKAYHPTKTDWWGPSGTATILGNRQSKGGGAFNGSVYAIRVYDRLLTAAERVQNRDADGVRFMGLDLNERLTLASTVDPLLGSFTPALGVCTDMTAGRQLTLSAKEDFTNEANTVATHCTGWKIYDVDDVEISSGSGTTCAYVHPTPAAYRKLVWQYETMNLQYFPVATPTLSAVTGRCFYVSASFDKLSEASGWTVKARTLVSTTGKADSYVQSGETVSVVSPSLDTSVSLVAKFADADFGKTGYVKVAFDTYDADGNLIGTQYTSAVSSAVDDKATYTWTGEGDGTSWSDSGNWSDNRGGEALGYPHQPNCTALFPGVTATVNFDQTVTFATLNVTNKDMNLVFTAGDGVAVTCATLYAGNSTSVKKRHGASVVFDGVKLHVSGNTEFRPNPGNDFTLTGGSELNVYKALLCVNDTEGTWYTETTLGVEDGSKLTVRNLLQLGGAGTLAISNATVSAATVYLNGIYKNGNGTYGGGGGRMRFYGDAPRLAVSSKMISENTSYTGCFGADIEFFVPEGGYADAPIVYSGTTKFLQAPSGTSNWGVIRVAVHGRSPILSSTSYGSWDLVSCSSATIDPTRTSFITPASTVTETMTLENGSNTLVYARYDPTSCLTVTGAPREFGTGAYGSRRGLASGDALALTPPVSDNANLTCAGYKIYDVAKDGTRTLSSSRSETSCAYTHGTTRRELVWQWSRPDVYVATNGNDSAEGDKDHPLATIQAGIDKYDCSVVHVSPGRYKTTATTAIAAGKLVEVRGEGTDPSAVVLEKTANDARVLTIAESLSTVTNITITNGDRALQGGVSMSKGLLAGCIVTHCSTFNNTYHGGGIYMTGGTVRGCVISNNLAQCSAGGGKCGGGIYMTGGLVENCRLVQNNATYGSGGHGGGIFATGGTIRGCLIDRCSARGNGFGICANDGNTWSSTATIENCTIVNNYHTQSGSTGMALGKHVRFRNNIVYGNSNVNGTANVSVGFCGTAEYNCTVPGFTYGDGNIGDPPVFEDASARDYRLQFCPCVNAALLRNWMDAAFDLTGTPRVVQSVPEMGCFERPASSTLACTFSATTSGGPDEANLILTSVVDGDTDGIVYYWRVIRADGSVVTRSGANEANPIFVVGAGDYDVELAVTNGAGKGSSTRVENVASVKASVAYANVNGSEEYPFQTLNGGSHDLETALDLLTSGGTLYVAPGTYVVSDRLNLASGRGTRIIALDGPSNTVIRAGNTTAFTSTGLCVVQMTAASSRLEGLTIVGGLKGPHYSGGEYAIRSGVVMSSGVITNCVIRDMYQGERTSSSALTISGGTATDVLIAHCYQAMSGGSPMNAIALRQSGGTLNRAVITNCWTSGTSIYVADGGLVVISGGDFRNSLVVNCTSSHSAPLCITAGKMDNCTIVGNRNTETTAGFNPAGGLIASGSAAVRNTLLSGNTSKLAGGAVSNLWCTGTQVTYSLTDDRETFAGEGNIAANPKFRRSAGKAWHVKSISPAVNAGLKLDWMTDGATDLDRQPRIKNGQPDIGCYEGELSGLLLIVR